MMAPLNNPAPIYCGYCNGIVDLSVYTVKFDNTSEPTFYHLKRCPDNNTHNNTQQMQQDIREDEGICKKICPVLIVGSLLPIIFHIYQNTINSK